MTQRWLAAAAATVVIGLTAAQADDGLTGTWRSTLDGLTMALHDDSSFLVVWPDGSELQGSYTQTDAVVSFENAPPDPGCGGNVGTYRVELAAQSAIFFAVEDACAGRREHLEATWERVAE